MGHKIKLSQKRKDQIKKKWDTLNTSVLNKNERRYLQLVVNGKNSAKKNVRFEGRYLSGRIVNIIEKVAERKGITLKKYLAENKESVDMLIETGSVTTQKKPEAVIDLIEAQHKKTVNVFNGTNKFRVDKMKLVEQVIMLQQYAASNTTMVQIGLPVKVYLDGQIEITMPYDIDYSDMDAEQLEQLFDDLEIFYIKSDKAE